METNKKKPIFPPKTGGLVFAEFERRLRVLDYETGKLISVPAIR